VIGPDHRVTFRPVRVGITGEMFFEVADGLSEGERIVSGPYEAVRKLQTGMLVREGPQ
jgi:HlyD family secretion protein